MCIQPTNKTEQLLNVRRNTLIFAVFMIQNYKMSQFNVVYQYLKLGSWLAQMLTRWYS